MYILRDTTYLECVSVNRFQGILDFDGKINMCRGNSTFDAWRGKLSVVISTPRSWPSPFLLTHCVATSGNDYSIIGNMHGTLFHVLRIFIKLS